MQHDLAMIVEGATRARRIVQNLLAFARQRAAHLEEVDLNMAVRQVLGLLAYQMHSHTITVEERLAPQLPMTVADATAIKQVLLNLLNNAQQALATWNGERRIIITTRAEEHDGQSRIVIDVADTGPGILPRTSAAGVRAVLYHQTPSVKGPVWGFRSAMASSNSITEIFALVARLAGALVLPSNCRCNGSFQNMPSTRQRALRNRCRRITCWSLMMKRRLPN